MPVLNRVWKAPARLAWRCVAVALLTAAVAALAPAAAGARVHPLVLLPGKTLDQLFGYVPDYVQNVPAFDALNGAFIRSRDASQDATGYVEALVAGVWQQDDFLAALARDIPGFLRTRNAAGWATDSIVFGLDGAAYTALTVDLAGARTGPRRLRVRTRRRLQQQCRPTLHGVLAIRGRRLRRLGDA